jgi:hypothetical protein
VFKSRQPSKKLLNGVRQRVDVTHRRLDVIVAGHVLQRKGSVCSPASVRNAGDEQIMRMLTRFSEDGNSPAKKINRTSEVGSAFKAESSLSNTTASAPRKSAF